MKLIIDISDKTYEIIKNMVYFYNSQRSGRGETKEIFTAIKQGTPLEEELEKIKEEINNIEPGYNFGGFYYCQSKVLDVIDERLAELKGENK